MGQEISKNFKLLLTNIFYMGNGYIVYILWNIVFGFMVQLIKYWIFYIYEYFKIYLKLYRSVNLQFCSVVYLKLQIKYNSSKVIFKLFKKVNIFF